MKNPPPTQNPRAGVSIAAIAATPYPSRVEKELLFLTPDDKSRGHSVHPRAVSFSQGWGFRTLPLPRGAGGTPLAGSGRRPGEGRPGPGRLALIRRFAAPSPSGRRDKPPDRGKMTRPCGPPLSSYRAVHFRPGGTYIGHPLVRAATIDAIEVVTQSHAPGQGKKTARAADEFAR